MISIEESDPNTYLAVGDIYLILSFLPNLWFVIDK